MELSWIYEQNMVLITIALFLAMMVAAEIADRWGKRLAARTPRENKGHFGAVQGSILGLSALLISFAFQFSIERFELRRELAVEDTASLDSLFTMASLLPDKPRSEFKRAMRRYVDARLEILRALDDKGPSALSPLLEKADAAYAALWNVVNAQSRENPGALYLIDMRRSVLDASSNASRRLNAFSSRVPDPILWLLLGTAVAAMAVIGFSAGLGNHRGMAARIWLAVMVCGAIYVVLDLDRPEQGWIRTDQSPMMRLQQTVAADAESH